MNFIKKIITWFDLFQQRHPVFGFPYAVIKKLGEDNGGYQAALITYYGFMSLFPLLLVAVMILGIVFHNNPDLQGSILSDITNFFPVVGDQLQRNIQDNGKTGLGLAVAILITLYGARGGADALRYALDSMWQIPHHRRAGFPKNILRSFGVIGIAALGLLVSVAISSFSSVVGHAVWVKLLVNVAGILVLTETMTMVFRVATSRAVEYKDMLPGTLFGATILQLLLTFGSILVKNQLKGLDSLYGTFAIVLGLLFWIYLLARVIVFSIEIDTVRTLKLWPRSVISENETSADQRAYDLYVKAARRIPEEKVNVYFVESEKKKTASK